MLSLILSRFFRLLFYFVLIAGIGSIIGQITLKPLEFKTGENNKFSFGKPGIIVTAKRIIIKEKQAPDTAIKYSSKSPNGNSESGEFSLNTDQFYTGKENLKKLIKTNKEKGGEIIIDTQINLIRELRNESYSSSTTSWGYDSIQNGKFVFNKSIRNSSTGKIIESIQDTFSSRAEAELMGSLSIYENNNSISQENNVKEKLRIMPANTTQHLLFVGIFIINGICFALLFLGLSRLFKNFYNKKFFTVDNVSLLKKSGIYFLIPQVLIFLFFWFFIRHLHPVKLTASSLLSEGFEWTSHYDIESGVDVTDMLIGIGMIIFSYIFKDAYTLKQEQDLTV